jgi:hypothetical protein
MAPAAPTRWEELWAQGRPYLAKRAYFAHCDATPGVPHVVLAMAKTGTSTIAAALRRAGIEPLFQVHGVNRAVAQLREGRYLKAGLQPYPRILWAAQWLGMHLPTEEQPWVIITSVRDPVERLVAGYFQEQYREGDDVDADAAVTAALQHFDERWQSVLGDWWEQQFHRVLDIDVLSLPFDPRTGHGVYELPTARVLVVRKENLSGADAVVERFVGRKLSRGLAPENLASDKAYNDAYAAVLHALRPPTTVLDEAYALPWVQHFYSADEIASFKARWQRGS